MNADQLTKLHTFFSGTIYPKQFASYVRRLQDYAIRQALESDDGDGTLIKEGHYWLNEFLEILDPKFCDD